MEYAEEQLQQQIEEKQKQMSEQALLAEEEKAVEERRKQTKERQKRQLERKAIELEKQRERERLRKEKRPKKRKEKTVDEEEEEPMVDDTDRDKDYNPEEDPEAEFVAEDQELEDEDMFEVEKHVHALNFEEAGEYPVAMNRYMEAFAKIIRRGKDDIKREYKKLIKFVKLIIEKLGHTLPLKQRPRKQFMRPLLIHNVWPGDVHSMVRKLVTARKYSGWRRKDGR